MRPLSLRPAMRLPQRFRRLPSEEPREEQDIKLPTYPSQTKMDAKSDVKGDFISKLHQSSTGTAHPAETCSAAEYTISHRKNLVERSEDYEHSRFGTRLFGTFYDTFVAGWRAGLLRAFLLSLVALIVNVSVYACLFSTYNTADGTATIMSGSCSMIRNANTGIHAALNVVSTMVLGASTYAMQGMTAPTRKEVDVAHLKGK